MYRIVMHALWSRDHVVSLSRLLKAVLNLDDSEVKSIFNGLARGESKEIICKSPGVAYDLSSELVQLGVFTSAEQIGPATSEIIAEDVMALLHEDLSMFEVCRDASGRVIRLVESNTLGYLNFGHPEVAEIVGKEVEKRGGKVVGVDRVEEVQAIVDALREERVKYAKLMTAQYGKDWKVAILENDPIESPHDDVGPAEEE